MPVRFLAAAAYAVGLLVLRPAESAAQRKAVSSTPVRTIAEAIAHREADREVTVGGRALVSAGQLQSTAFDVAIEDTSGAIRIFSRAPQPDVKEGDSVAATGAIKRYRGNLELVATSVQVVKVPRRPHTPRDLPIDTSILSRHAGRVVRVHGHVAGTGISEGGQWARLQNLQPASEGTLTIWVPANHGAPVDLTKVRVGDSLVVTGVVTSYQDNADDPMVWQLVPRDAADVQRIAARGGIPEWFLWAALAGAIIIGIALSVSRINARRQLHALKETDTRYNQLLALLPDAVVVHGGGRILFANPASATLLGLSTPEALVGRPLAEFVHADSQQVITTGTAVTDRTDTLADATQRIRARLVAESGTIVDVDITASACTYRDQPATILLARDISAQLRHERDLHALALVDELTGLANRRAFSLFAEQELARARRSGRTPMLVFADLDGLKQINDEHGHAAGDAAIRLVASALKSILREADIVARWSGDEFVALMGEGSEEAAQEIGARLDAAIATQSPANQPYVVTASVGANPLDPALSLRDAMDRADAKLYAEKKRGRRSTTRHSPPGIDAIT